MGQPNKSNERAIYHSVSVTLGALGALRSSEFGRGEERGVQRSCLEGKLLALHVGEEGRGGERRGEEEGTTAPIVRLYHRCSTMFIEISSVRVLFMFFLIVQSRYRILRGNPSFFWISGGSVDGKRTLKGAITTRSHYQTCTVPRDSMLVLCVCFTSIDTGTMRRSFVVASMSAG